MSGQSMFIQSTESTNHNSTTNSVRIKSHTCKICHFTLKLTTLLGGKLSRKYVLGMPHPLLLLVSCQCSILRLRNTVLCPGRDAHPHSLRHSSGLPRGPESADGSPELLQVTLPQQNLAESKWNSRMLPPFKIGPK